MEGLQAPTVCIEVSSDLAEMSAPLTDAFRSAGVHVTLREEERTPDRSPVLDASVVVIDVSSIGAQLLIGAAGNALWEAIKSSLTLILHRSKHRRLHIALIVERDATGGLRKVSLDAEGKPEDIAKALESLRIEY